MILVVGNVFQYSGSLTTMQRIQKARITVMRDPRFMALTGIFMTGMVKVSDRKGLTAATNGRDEVYGEGFVAGINDKQLRFLVTHEAYHKLLQHRIVWKGLSKLNHERANMAMDYVINGMLDNTAGANADNFMEFIPCGCLDHKYDGMNTKQVYDLLVSKGGGKGVTTDEHDFDGNDELPALDDDEVEELQVSLDQALRQGVYLAGKMGGNIDRTIQDLLEVQVPWEEVLQEFVTSCAAGLTLSTWRKPSRRWLGRDVYAPSQYDNSTKTIIVGIDTSGSISQRDLTMFLTEVKAAIQTAQPEKVIVIYWDARVARVEVYEGDEVQNIVDTTKPAGGGGTDVQCMADYLRDNQITADCIIQFTDGYVPSWGNPWPAPVLWCVTTDTVADNGKTLRVRV